MAFKCFIENINIKFIPNVSMIMYYSYCFQIYNYVPHRTFMRTLNIHEINENKIHIKGI